MPVTHMARVRLSSRPPFMRGWLSGLKLRTANALWVNNPPGVRISPLAPGVDAYSGKTEALRQEAMSRRITKIGNRIFPSTVQDNVWSQSELNEKALNLPINFYFGVLSLIGKALILSKCRLGVISFYKVLFYAALSLMVRHPLGLEQICLTCLTRGNLFYE